MGGLHKNGWLGMMILVALTSGCTDNDADRLARIGRKVMSRSEAAVASAGAELPRGWRGPASCNGETSLDKRVSLRLKWDKGLQGCDIAVEVKETTVTLKGKAPEAAQKLHAVELAQGTVGVEKVQDLVEVGR
jgi:osmotically-inducible protein OsmY